MQLSNIILLPENRFYVQHFVQLEIKTSVDLCDINK